MSQILKIVKWEFVNRVKTKLFLITTFVLPFLMGGLMFLPTILMDFHRYCMDFHSFWMEVSELQVQSPLGDVVFL